MAFILTHSQNYRFKTVVLISDLMKNLILDKLDKLNLEYKFENSELLGRQFLS